MSLFAEFGMLLGGTIITVFFFRRKHAQISVPHTITQLAQPDTTATIDAIITVNERIRETLVRTRIALLEQHTDLIESHQRALEGILQTNNERLENLHDQTLPALDLLEAEQRIELVGRLLDEERRRRNLRLAKTSADDADV